MSRGFNKIAVIGLLAVSIPSTWAGIDSGGGLGRVCFTTGSIVEQIRKPGPQQGLLLDQYLGSITSITTFDLYEALLPEGLDGTPVHPVTLLPGENARQYVTRMQARFDKLLPGISEGIARGLERFPDSRIVLHREPLARIYDVNPDSAVESGNCALFTLAKQENISGDLSDPMTYYLHLDSRILNHPKFVDPQYGQLNLAVLFLHEVIYSEIRYQDKKRERDGQGRDSCDDNDDGCIPVIVGSSRNYRTDLSQSDRVRLILRSMVRDRGRSLLDWSNFLFTVNFDATIYPNVVLNQIADGLIKTTADTMFGFNRTEALPLLKKVERFFAENRIIWKKIRDSDGRYEGGQPDKPEILCTGEMNYEYVFSDTRPDLDLGRLYVFDDTRRNINYGVDTSDASPFYCMALIDGLMGASNIGLEDGNTKVADLIDVDSNLDDLKPQVSEFRNQLSALMTRRAGAIETALMKALQESYLPALKSIPGISPKDVEEIRGALVALIHGLSQMSSQESLSYTYGPNHDQVIFPIGVVSTLQLRNRVDDWANDLPEIDVSVP